MKGPTVQSIFHYACHTLALRTFLDQPGDGRTQPEIPAACLSWALLIGAILRIRSANRLEWLARSADRKQLGLARGFGDDALAYFTERVDPEAVRQRTALTLKLARYNKVFEQTAFLGLAIDGSGAGRAAKEACPLCRPVKDSHGDTLCQLHYFVMISVVGAGVTLPFDVEPYGPGDSEYAAGERVLKRSAEHLGPRLDNYPAVDGKFATARFLHGAEELDLPVMARLKDNLPELSVAVAARFGRQPPALIEFSIARLGALTFFKLAKSRWEIETQGLNDGKNLYGIKHIQHHHPNSMLANWLFLLFALITGRLYRNRPLHRGTHPILTSMQLKDTIGLHARPAHADTS